jgi:hypothetical protein
LNDEHKLTKVSLAYWIMDDVSFFKAKKQIKLYCVQILILKKMFCV